MEEILASIRRIIADDEGAKGQTPKPAESAASQPVPSPHPAPAARMAPSAIEPVDLRASAVTDEIDEFSPPASFARAAELEPADEASPEILDLSEPTAAEPPPARGLRAIDAAELDFVFGERRASPPPQPAPPVAAEPPASETPSWHASERSEPAPQRGEHTLISATTSAAVDSAFNTLAQTVLVQNGRTLEDLVREMLRPMLKSWLDDNLPGMVERMVRAEIERVSRGRP